MFVNRGMVYILYPLVGHHSTLGDMTVQLLANIDCHVVEHNQVNKSRSVFPHTLLGNCKLVENQIQGNTLLYNHFECVNKGKPDRELQQKDYHNNLVDKFHQ